MRLQAITVWMMCCGLSVHLSEWVSVNTAGGRPALVLENGGVATYVSGTGSDTLLFRYDVDALDASRDQLSVDAVALNGGQILDIAGNALEVMSDAIVVGGELLESSRIAIDTQAPVLVDAQLVEDAASANDVVNDGYYKAGTTVAFDVRFDDALVVSEGELLPFLALSNGQQAFYVADRSDLSQGVMRFEYTVSESDINSSALKVLGLAEQDTVISDAVSNEAIVSIDDAQLAYDTLVIDTVDPQAVLSESYEPVLLQTSESMTVTLSFSEPVDPATFSVAAFSLGAVAGGTLSDTNGHAQTTLGGESVAQIVANSFVQIDAQTFTVDIAPVDLFKGEVEISLTGDGVRDLAGNPLVDVAAITQPIDTLTTSFEITPVAGPFVGSEASVRLYRADGSELTVGQDYKVDYNTDSDDGKVQITLVNGYRGPMLIEVKDESASSTDYTDELTKQQVSLDTELRTMVVVDAPAPESDPITVIVSPLTELAVRKAGIEVDTIPTALTTEQVTYNDKVADLFGLNGIDITKTPVTTTLDAAFDEGDGLDASEAYGKVLATLSVQDSQTGSVRNTIESLVTEITEATDGETGVVSLSFTAETAEDIAQAGNVVDLMQDTADIATSENAIAVAEALKAVIRTAANEQPLVTEQQLTLLGVSGVDSNTLDLARRLLEQTADDGSAVDTIAKIDALLSEALVALQTVASAAEANTADSSITHAHYSALGYADLSAEFEASLATVLNRTTVGSEQVNTVAEIETLIATYQNLFDYVADAETADHMPTEADYVLLGVSDAGADVVAVLIRHWPMMRACRR